VPDPHPQPTRVGAIILAAGSSSRLGQPKQLLTLDGRPVLQHALDAAAEAGLDEIVVVLGHRAPEIEGAVSLPTGARVVFNADYAAGQSTSLRAGIGALASDTDAAIVLLGDQPGITSAAIRVVAAAHASTRAAIVRAAYSGEPSHPVLFAREMWPTLLRASGDRGARDVIAATSERVDVVECGGHPPPDIDTWEDYLRLRG
jgi:molybdenum cofactor cytidylyltransferase